MILALADARIVSTGTSVALWAPPPATTDGSRSTMPATARRGRRPPPPRQSRARAPARYLARCEGKPRCHHRRAGLGERVAPTPISLKSVRVAITGERRRHKVARAVDVQERKIVRLVRWRCVGMAKAREGDGRQSSVRVPGRSDRRRCSPQWRYRTRATSPDDRPGR